MTELPYLSNPVAAVNINLGGGGGGLLSSDAFETWLR